MIHAVELIAAIAAAYQLIAWAACIKHLAATRAPDAQLLPIAILKPVHGDHPGFDEALRSHLDQDYPDFDILIASLPNALPDPRVHTFRSSFTVPNGKVANLMELERHTEAPILIVNDADIVVPPGYLRAVTAPLADPGIGLVTCLYRAVGDSFPARFEALGVATDFAPSALVAPLFGVSEFGFGSTLAFRRSDLIAIGGFGAVGPYLADDYHLGLKIHQLGRRNLISRVVVQTRLNARTWTEAWRHQLRWARTVRLSRLDGYLGLPATFATLWALLAALAGFPTIAISLLAIRMVMALTAGWFVLRSPDVLRLAWAIPLRDLYSVAIWLAALFGDTVEWGGETLRLDFHGRIVGRASIYPKVRTSTPD